MGKYEGAFAEIMYSSQTNEGRDEVWRTIMQMCDN